MEFDIIRRSIAEVLGVDASEITEETTFIKDLGADSLDAYQIILKLEDAFEIQIEQSDVEHMQTVGELLAFIKR